MLLLCVCVRVCVCVCVSVFVLGVILIFNGGLGGMLLLLCVYAYECV